eukprot:1189841-Prorocentrum_minimum.AAC.4
MSNVQDNTLTCCSFIFIQELLFISEGLHRLNIQPRCYSNKCQRGQPARTGGPLLLCSARLSAVIYKYILCHPTDTLPSVAILNLPTLLATRCPGPSRDLRSSRVALSSLVSSRPNNPLSQTDDPRPWQPAARHAQSEFPLRPGEFPLRPGEFPLRPGEFPLRPGEFPLRPGEFLPLQLRNIFAPALPMRVSQMPTGAPNRLVPKYGPLSNAPLQDPPNRPVDPLPSRLGLKAPRRHPKPKPRQRPLTTGYSDPPPPPPPPPWQRPGRRRPSCRPPSPSSRRSGLPASHPAPACDARCASRRWSPKGRRGRRHRQRGWARHPPPGRLRGRSSQASPWAWWFFGGRPAARW